MNPDAVYTLLAEANPVPDSRSITPVLERLHPDPTGSNTMQLTATRPTESETRPPKPQRWMMAAAAAVIAIAAVAVILFARDEPDPVEPATQLTTVPVTAPSAPAELTEAEAIAVARRYHAALLGGDVDAVMAVTDSVGDPQADRHVAEMWAAMVGPEESATIGDCTATSNTGSVVVRCDIVINDPVWVELGVNDLVTPVRITDGKIRWLPYEGADFGEGNRAYADYLQAVHPADYEAVCSPAAYEIGTIVSNRGLALTGACTELWFPLADDVVQWIRDGRPDPDA